jgi:uncharacterized protein (TIGR02453 family)
MAVAFTGFSPEAFDFYDRLEAHNDREFWTANKAEYERLVRRPMEALCAELADYGRFHLYRPYNDMRFAKGRPPYKTHQGAYTQGPGGGGHYVQVSADGLMAASGYYAMAKDQLDRFRDAVDDPDLGAEIAGLTDGLVASGYEIGAHETLKTAPRGFPKDHPRVELLRRKGLMAWRSWPPARWMHGREAVRRVQGVFSDVAPMAQWLDRHVGPSDLPSDQMGR